MHLSTSIARALGAAAAVAFLASCAGNGSTINPAAGNGTMGQQALTIEPAGAGDPNKAAVPFAYISDQEANTVTIFGSDGKIQRQLTDGIKTPEGLFVDPKGNLWVANAGRDNVLEFAPGAKKAELTLEAPGNETSDVAICKDGNVFVAGNPALDVYSRGSTTPTRALTFPHAAGFSGVMCDKNGNVFATGIINYRSGVVEFPGGVKHRAKQLPIALGAPGGIKPDAAGNLLIGDQVANTIAEYTEAGVATGRSITTAFDCIKFGVSTTSTVVGCAVYVTPVSSGAPTSSSGISYGFPGGKTIQTFESTKFNVPGGFAFAR
jgi:hypothetical protein